MNESAPKGTSVLDESGDYDYRNSWQHPEGSDKSVIIDAATKEAHDVKYRAENDFENSVENRPSDEELEADKEAIQRVQEARDKLRKLQKEDAEQGVFHETMEAARQELADAEAARAETYSHVKIGAKASEAQQVTKQQEATIDQIEHDVDAAYEKDGVRL